MESRLYIRHKEYVIRLIMPRVEKKQGAARLVNHVRGAYSLASLTNPLTGNHFH